VLASTVGSIMSYEAVPERTVLGLPLADRLLLAVGAPALGMVLGFFLPRLARWAATLPWAPLQGPLKLVASFDKRWVDVVAVGAGLVLGLGFAAAAFAESTKLTLTDTGVELRRNDKTRNVARAAVDAVFVDGKDLVVLDRESRQLVRERYEGKADEVERAFRAHRYPWLPADPYAELYRRWVPDMPDLPPAVNAVLKARAVALTKKIAVDVAELRDDVQKLGYVVRDEGSRQYWRPLIRS
jgi:hypothetical protein